MAVGPGDDEPDGKRGQRENLYIGRGRAEDRAHVAREEKNQQRPESEGADASFASVNLGSGGFKVQRDTDGR